MKKIPTVFKRDPDDLKHLLPEVHEDCQWVLDGEGVPTRKYDGTCVMLEPYNGLWWARREVKPGKEPPPYFAAIRTDEATGKTVGWEPIGYSGFAKWHADALSHYPDAKWRPGTYELCGPKINGNPERFQIHTLRLHETADHFTVRPEDLTFAGLAVVCRRLLDVNHIEGIVWHHPDGRMAKLKGRDFAFERQKEASC